MFLCLVLCWSSWAFQHPHLVFCKGALAWTVWHKGFKTTSDSSPQFMDICTCQCARHAPRRFISCIAELEESSACDYRSVLKNVPTAGLRARAPRHPLTDPLRDYRTHHCFLHPRWNDYINSSLVGSILCNGCRRRKSPPPLPPLPEVYSAMADPLHHTDKMGFRSVIPWRAVDYMRIMQWTED